MIEQDEGKLTITIPLEPPERSRLDAVCGPKKPAKRGQWVREAILEKLDREAPEAVQAAAGSREGKE